MPNARGSAGCRACGVGPIIFPALEFVFGNQTDKTGTRYESAAYSTSLPRLASLLGCIRAMKIFIYLGILAVFAIFLIAWLWFMIAKPEKWARYVDRENDFG